MPPTEQREGSGRAFARAGLLGNPSDGYGGKAMAITLPDFSAEVRLVAAERFAIVPGPTDGLAFASAREAADAWRAGACEDGLRLLRAALARFGRAWPGFDALPADDPRLRFEMRYTTDIPRQVGLAGSSAIVVAALRALADWFAVPLAPFDLAEWALAAEVDELGIAAGAMDRVCQAYEGFMLMDLREPRRPEAYARLDPGDLPSLWIAWDPAGGQSSGRAHGDLRARWRRGDADVLDAIRAFRDRVDAGVEALRVRDHATFRRLMDENFDARCAIFDVGPRDREMVSIARAHGAAAKLCGSGGAVVLSPGPATDAAALERALEAAGYRTRVPDLARLGSPRA